MARSFINLLLLGLMSALTVVCGCAPAEDRLANPTEPPRPTATAPRPTRAPVRGASEDLIIQLDDLPSGFLAVTAEENGSDGYTAFYVRAEALGSEGEADGNLLAVVVNLMLHDNAAAARNAFAVADALDEQSLARSMGQASQDAVVIDAAEHPVRLEEAGDAIAFRVLYEIGPVSLVDYRYRFVVSNAVANVVVTALAETGGEDPPGMAEQAQVIAERQLSHLIRATE